MFVLETDASKEGIDAIPSYNNHPISYFSKRMTLGTHIQSTNMRKFFAITKVVKS